MHVDLDYFFAQCEERENLSLRDKPVVVCVYSGRTADSGAVSTTNYVARRLGVKSGIPIVMAKKILKDADAVFLPVNHGLYEKVSNSIMTLLRGYGDRFEQVGIDEAYLEVTERIGGRWEKAREIGLTVKNAILDAERLTSSIGVGPNKLIAKTASDFQKPDGLTVVQPQEVKSFLSPLPVGKLYGVGKKTEQRLAEMGVKTVEELAKIDPQELCALFGKSNGLYLHNAANGIDEEPVREREGREQISRIATLKQNTRDTQLIFPELDRLSQEVHTKAVEAGLGFRSVGIIAIMEDLSIHSRSRTFENPSQELNKIRNVARELFTQFLGSDGEMNVRRIGVKLSNLVKPTGQKALSDFLGA